MTPLHITQRATAGTLERRGYAAFARTLRRTAPIAALLFLSPATVVPAQELGAKDQINVGIAKSASPQVRRSAEAEKALRVEPTRTFEYADHVANGVAMRNRTAGTIHLRGAPVPSKVLAALLYFNFSDGSRDGQRNVPILFNANRVIANKTGDHDDPSWGMTGNHSYVADVTQLVPIGGDLNQDYQVVLHFDAETSTTGQNPWATPEPGQKIRTEGATLVIVYRTKDTTGPLFIYDAFEKLLLRNSAVRPPASELGQRRTVHDGGADGQRASVRQFGRTN